MKFPVLSEVSIKTPKNQFNDMALLKYLAYRLKFFYVGTMMVIRDIHNWKVTLRNREQGIIVTGTTAINAIEQQTWPFIFCFSLNFFF
jgi:hypothetical protein